jgi:hypothetical protein
VERLLLVALLASGTPEGWVAVPSTRITPNLVSCANWSRREWLVQVSGESVKPVQASDDRRQDPVPFPINFRGAIPFPGDLPDQKDAVPRLDWQVAPEAQAAFAELKAQVSPGHEQWALTYGESYARRYVVRLSGGWLIGYGGGEFGGSLWWYAAPGAGRRIGEGNVVDILPVAGGREALVFGGLSHMGIDQGRVFRFTTTTEPELRLVSDLGASPEVAIAESDESALVLTTRQLWRVAVGGRAERLCALESVYLYPRSMTLLPSGEVWVGMRYFVVRLKPSSDGKCDVQWFAPADCPSLVRQRPDEECACRR